MPDQLAGETDLVELPSASGSSCSSRISTLAIEQIIERLKNEKHRESTRKIYRSVWKNFNEFFVRLDRKPSNWEDRIVLYVGYLVHSKRKSTMIRSYISAIHAVLLNYGVKLSEDLNLLSSLTRAC